MTKLKVYLAAPFFNDEQRSVCESIEQALLPICELYSPRKDGVLTQMKTPEERKRAAPKIFNRNIEKMNWADLIVAVIDDRDPGVMFEIGWSYSNATEIVTFTAKNYGVNLMIQGAAKAHAKSVEDLVTMIKSGLDEDTVSMFPAAEAIS